MAFNQSLLYLHSHQIFHLNSINIKLVLYVCYFRITSSETNYGMFMTICEAIVLISLINYEHNWTRKLFIGTKFTSKWIHLCKLALQPNQPLLWKTGILKLFVHCRIEQHLKTSYKKLIHICFLDWIIDVLFHIGNVLVLKEESVLWTKSK